MTRKAIVIAVVVLMALGLSGLWYTKRKLWEAQPAGAIPIRQKEQSVTDLRPAAIAKLQQLVLKASDSLYKLGIDSLDTDVSSGSIVVKGVSLIPDPAAESRLHKLRRLPDNVFTARVALLRISGIGLEELVDRNDIHLRSIECIGPSISVRHRKQPYNEQQRTETKHTSLYGRLKTGQLERLIVDSIRLQKGQLFSQSQGRKASYDDVTILISDLRVDSASEYDRNRFLFAKQLWVQAGRIQLPVGKSDYNLEVQSATILASERRMRLSGLKMKPNGGRQAFLSKQKERKVVFDIEVPVVELSDVDWWAMARHEAISAGDVTVKGGTVKVFLDEHLPLSPRIEKANFPHQKLVSLKSPVSIKTAKVSGLKLIYEEFTMRSQKLSSITFANISARASHLSNVAKDLATNPVARFQASGRFMNTTPINVDLRLELPKEKKGGFTASVSMGAINHATVNHFSEGMGLVRFTSGQHHSGKAVLRGNNDRIDGSVSIRYTDMHLEPLKVKPDEPGKLKGKKVVKKVANVLFVKDNNPSRGKMREPDIVLDRTVERNFFSFIWKALKQGLLKTIGIPLRFANAQ